MARKWESLNVVQLYASWAVKSKEVWRQCLYRATKSGNIDKLISYRYGIQAGLADAIKKGFKNEKLDLWSIQRCYELEQCVKIIAKRKYPMPGDKVVSKTHKGKRVDYVMSSVEAKRARDREVETFLQKSNF